MNKFDLFPNNGNPEKGPSPRKTAEYKISDEDMEAFVDLLEKAITREEKSRIVRAAMFNAGIEALLVANDTMSANMKEFVPLAGDDDSWLADIAIRDSYFLELNEKMRKDLNTRRKELGLPPKFTN